MKQMHNIHRIIFATGNQGKVNEFKQMLGDDFEILSMKDLGAA